MWLSRRYQDICFCILFFTIFHYLLDGLPVIVLRTPEVPGPHFEDCYGTLCRYKMGMFWIAWIIASRIHKQGRKAFFLPTVHPLLWVKYFRVSLNSGQRYFFTNCPWFLNLFSFKLVACLKCVPQPWDLPTWNRIPPLRLIVTTSHRGDHLPSQRSLALLLFFPSTCWLAPGSLGFFFPGVPHP